MHLDAFQSLADPTRRRIVETLRSGELQVGEIVQQAGIHQSGVSRHLRILHESGFVSVRPDGQRRLYSLKPEPFQEARCVALAVPGPVGGTSGQAGCGPEATTEEPENSEPEQDR
ncbi:ArsR/SmtB family transcription factor [Archangium gephyra]|uniref:ArsR/SmtB family transcription factor n=1 Tax=Archangium gephyra TaxID=48 RepID=UPI003B7A68EC